MFYQAVESGWKAGAVKVGLLPVGFGDAVTVEAQGLTGVMAKFLTEAERRQLSELAKIDAAETKRLMAEYQNGTQEQRDQFDAESRQRLLETQQRLKKAQRQSGISMVLAMVAVALSLYLSFR